MKKIICCLCLALLIALLGCAAHQGNGTQESSQPPAVSPTRTPGGLTGPPVPVLPSLDVTQPVEELRKELAAILRKKIGTNEDVNNVFVDVFINGRQLIVIADCTRNDEKMSNVEDFCVQRKEILEGCILYYKDLDVLWDEVRMEFVNVGYFEFSKEDIEIRYGVRRFTAAALQPFQ
ncbi:hypothetical protein LJB83_01150 [Clostridia bacterium OttesenSCG-928-F22]|nr:hypothetical protein [Clostridia bacterium OttesenSCG-928-F22]